MFINNFKKSKVPWESLHDLPISIKKRIKKEGNNAIITMNVCVNIFIYYLTSIYSQT